MKYENGKLKNKQFKMQKIKRLKYHEAKNEKNTQRQKKKLNENKKDEKFKPEHTFKPSECDVKKREYFI